MMIDDKIQEDNTSQRKSLSAADLGERLYQWRDFTPLPIIFILLCIAAPNVGSATVGTLVVLCGIIFRIYCQAYIQMMTKGQDEDGPGVLITSGPYGVVRNPMYLANLIIVTGILIFSSQAWFSIVALGAFVFQYYHIVKYEESLLVEKFGDEFQRYLDTVPGWIPTRWPKRDDFPMVESVWPAIEKERRSLIATAGILFGLILTS